MSGHSGSSAQAERSFVQRAWVWWDVAYAVIVGANALIWGLVPDLGTGRRVLGLGLIGAGILAYVLVGKRLLERGDKPIFLRIGYVVVIAALVVVLLLLEPFNHLLLAVVFPHLWMILPTRWAIPLSSLLAGLIVVPSALASGWSLEAALTGLAASLVLAGISVLMGLWITGIVNESEKRQHLIGELERTRAELAEAHHRSGVLAERERLAIEIHDTLAQGFMSILMLIQAPPTPERMAAIERTARENLAEARSLIEALGPGDLRNGTLAQACARIVERHVNATFTLCGEPRKLAANSEVVLLRATQEALTNVRKHAAASHVNVRLTYAGSHTSVEIHDDGRGFVSSNCNGDEHNNGHAGDPAHGYGLRGMRNRVDQVNGTLEIVSTPGRGTTVKVVVP